VVPGSSARYLAPLTSRPVPRVDKGHHWTTPARNPERPVGLPGESGKGIKSIRGSKTSAS
jgi:hypothetical protein